MRFLFKREPKEALFWISSRITFPNSTPHAAAAACYSASDDDDDAFYFLSETINSLPPYTHLGTREAGGQGPVSSQFMRGSWSHPSPAQKEQMQGVRGRGHLRLICQHQRERSTCKLSAGARASARRAHSLPRFCFQNEMVDTDTFVHGGWVLHARLALRLRLQLFGMELLRVMVRTFGDAGSAWVDAAVWSSD